MKRSIILPLLFAVMVTATAATAIAASNQPTAATATEAQTAATAALTDFRNLTNLADLMVSKENRLVVITVRGTGKVPPTLKRYTIGHPSCEHDGNQCEFTLRFNKQGDAAKVAQATEQWIAQASAQLKNKRNTSEWRINIQGVLPNNISELDTVWQQAERTADAIAVESYEDAGSRSITYQSPQFQSYIVSAGKQLQLQIAAHRSTETNQWRVTLGTPIILIEY